MLVFVEPRCYPKIRGGESIRTTDPSVPTQLSDGSNTGHASSVIAPLLTGDTGAFPSQILSFLLLLRLQPIGLHPARAAETQNAIQ
jgi:hypothetical protein